MTSINSRTTGLRQALGEIARWRFLGVTAFSTLAATGLGLALSVGAPNALQAQQMSRDSTLIIARRAPVNTLDPQRADYAETNYVVSAFYDTLISYNSDGEMVPELALEYVISDDATSIALTLRDDAVFHDGTPVTAEDVAYTLDRVMRLGAGVAGQVEGYVSTDVTDDTHLTIHLDGPNALFLGGLSKIYILNSELVRANAGDDDGQAWLQGNEAGSGPFTLQGFQNNAYIGARFDSYWAPMDGRPETLVFRRIDESSTAQAELRAGNIDLFWGFAASEAEASVASSSEVEMIYVATPIQADVVFNTITGPTADPVVRNAIAMSYDYEGALEGIHQGYGTIGNGPLPTTLACRPNLPQASQDIEEARAMLEEAGYADLSLVMNFQPVFAEQQREATLLQSNLRDIGVSLELEPIAFPDYLARLQDPDTIPQLMLFTDFAQFPDTGVVLINSFHSDAIGRTNRSGYSNPEVDALLDEAVGTADPDARCDLYMQVQTILEEDGVYMDMYTMERPIAYRPEHLTNIEVSPVVYPIAPANLQLAGE